MILTTEVIVELIRLAIKYGPDAAIAMAKVFKTGATIDDAIAALEVAKLKTAEQYLADAKAEQPATPTP